MLPIAYRFVTAYRIYITVSPLCRFDCFVHHCWVSCGVLQNSSRSWIAASSNSCRQTHAPSTRWHGGRTRAIHTAGAKLAAANINYIMVHPLETCNNTYSTCLLLKNLWISIHCHSVHCVVGSCDTFVSNWAKLAPKPAVHGAAIPMRLKTELIRHKHMVFIRLVEHETRGCVRDAVGNLQ